MLKINTKFSFITLISLFFSLFTTQTINQHDLSVRILPQEHRYISLDIDYEEFDFYDIDSKNVNEQCQSITQSIELEKIQQLNQDGEVIIKDLKEQIIKMYKFPISSPSVVQGLIISESGLLFYFEDVFSSSEKTKQSIKQVFQPEKNEICYDFIRLTNGLLMVCINKNQDDSYDQDFGIFIPIYYDKDCQEIIFKTNSIQKLNNFKRKLSDNCLYDIEYRESLILRFCENSNTNEIEFWNYNFQQEQTEDGETYQKINLNFVQLWQSSLITNMKQLKFLLSNYVLILDEQIGLLLLQIGTQNDGENSQQQLDLNIVDQYNPSKNDYYQSFQLIEKYGNTSINTRFIQSFVDLTIISKNYIYLMSGELEFTKLSKNVYYKQSLIQLLGKDVVNNSILRTFKADESNMYLYLSDQQETNLGLAVIRYYYDKAFSVKQFKHYSFNNYIFVYQMPAVLYSEIRLRTFIVTFKQTYSILTMTNSICYMLIIKAQNKFNVSDEQICQFDIKMYQKNTLIENLQISLFGTQIDNKNVGYYCDHYNFNYKFSKPSGDIYLNNFYGPALNYTIQDISSQQSIFWYKEFEIPFEKNKVGQYFPLNSNGIIYQVYTLIENNQLLAQECYSEEDFCSTYLLGFLDQNEIIQKVFFCEETSIFLVMTNKSNVKGRRFLLGSDSSEKPCHDFQFKYPITDYSNFHQTLQGNMVAFHRKSKKCLYLSFPFDLNNLYSDESESIFYNLDCLYFSSTYKYLDMTLLDQGYIFAKVYQEIVIYFIDYAFNSYIKGVYSYGQKLLSQTNLQNFDFILVRTIRTKLIIIDYDTNEILEYILYSFEEPIFARKYATFGKQFDKKQGIQKCNDMIAAFTTDGEIMIWWTQGESVDNLVYVLPNTNFNFKLIPQINLQDYKEFNFVLSADNYKIYLGKHNNINTKLIGYDNDSKKIVKSTLNIFSNLDKQNVITQELTVNFDNQDLFILNREDVQLPQFEIDYNPIIQIYPDQIYQGPIEQYSLSGNNVDAFRISPFLTEDGEGFTLKMNQGQLIDLIALSDYFLTLSIKNDKSYLTVMNQKQVFDSQKYVCYIINEVLQGLDLTRGGYIEINKIRSEIRGDQYNILIKDKFAEDEQSLNQDTSNRNIIFIDLTLFTSEEKDWSEAVQNQKYLNIDKIRKSAQSDDFFSINLNKIIQIIPMEFSKKLFFIASVYQNSIQYENQKDCILYIFAEDLSINDGEYIHLTLLSEITSTDLQYSWLEIGDLYESKARLASQKNQDIYNLTIFFHDYISSINLLKYQINVKDLTAGLIEKQHEKIDFLKQYDDNMTVQIIQQLYKLSSDQKYVSITLVTDYILLTAHYNVETLKRKKDFENYQDYTGCRVQANEFEEGQVSQRGNYLVQYCEPTQYMTDIKYNSNNLQYKQDPNIHNKYLKLYINYHDEDNHSILQMVQISPDIMSQHLIMRFDEDNKGDIYGLNMFAIHQNKQMLVAYKYKIKDHLEITNTDLISTIKNQKNIKINLIAKNNFSPSVPYQLSIRGFIPENWTYISIFIFVPIIACLCFLIYHCVIQTQRGQRRMDRHIKQFNDNEKPLLEQEIGKDLLLQKMIQNKGKTHSGSSNDLILLDISKIIGTSKNQTKNSQNQSRMSPKQLEKIEENKLDETLFTSSEDDSDQDDDFSGDQFYLQKQQIQNALNNESKIYGIN